MEGNTTHFSPNPPPWGRQLGCQTTRSNTNSYTPHPTLLFSCFVHQNGDKPWWPVTAQCCPVPHQGTSFRKMRDTDRGRTCCFAATYSSPGLIVVQVHHDAGALVGASLVDSLALPGVNELLGKAVSIFNVIPAATPKPVPG